MRSAVDVAQETSNWE